MIALTDKQERFVAEYLIDQNASAAARRAGYSPRSASSVATELMRTPHVRERVEQALRDMLAEIKCTAMALMRERMRAAFFRARRLFKGNELRAFDELDDDTYDALFISYEVRESGPIIRVRQPNREQALRALERVHERLDRLQDARCQAAEGAAAAEEAGAQAAEAQAAAALAPAAIVAATEGATAETDSVSTQAGVPERAPQHEPAPEPAPAPGDRAATPVRGEKTQVFAGSPTIPVPAKPGLSLFAGVIAAWRARRGHATPGAKPGGGDSSISLRDRSRPLAPDATGKTAGTPLAHAAFLRGVSSGLATAT